MTSGASLYRERVLTFKQLTELTDDDLIAKYDEAAKNTTDTPFYVRDEINRRSNDRLGKRMLHLTYANTALAAVAAVVAIIALLVGR